MYGADTRLELWLFIVLWALAYGAGILNWAIVGDYFGRARFATLRGMMGMIFSIGAIVGPVILGWYYDKSGEYTTGILILLIVAIMATVCGNSRKTEDEDPAMMAEAVS